MITEDDMARLHDECVSVSATADAVNAWFRALQVDPEGVFSFGKVTGYVGKLATDRKELSVEDAIGAAAVAGIELGMRIERLRREREL